MVTELGLAGYELVAYALVHQFSMKSKAGMYTGGVPYLASWLSCSLETARKYLHQLEEKGLILAKRGTNEGVPYCYYQVVDNQIPKILRDTPKYLRGDTQNFKGDTPKKIGVEYKEEYKTESNNTPTPFDYRKSVIDLGVPEPLADAFMKVRKTKKAIDSEIAFNGLKSQIEKSGLPPKDCIEMCVINSWKGFRADWLEHRKGPYQMPTAQNRRNTQFVD